MEGGGGGGCDPGVTVDSGDPLLRAVFLRRLRLTRLLLEGGAYVNESDRRGQTPLMVACRTQHVDAQSASRLKMVQFLLERGADPNIQDKDGRSALMHACRERAGLELVSLMLASGADASLEDRSGTSALVHAVTAGDWKVLKLLLDTCKANGKEVIIIATNSFPCGRVQAKQYLSMPSLCARNHADKPTAAPASPSEIQLVASPEPAAAFSFPGSPSCGVSSHPCSPSRPPRLGREAAHGPQQHLLRLNSEPWLKIPEPLPSSSSSWSSGGGGKELDQREELLPLRIPKLDEDDGTLPTTGGFRRHDGRLARDRGGEPKMSLPGLLPVPHSASHTNLHSANPGKDSPSSPSSFSISRGLCSPLRSMASSSLHRMLQRHKRRAEVYSSDPQLAADTRDVPEESRQRARDPTDGRRLAPLGCSSALGPREAASGASRRALSGLDQRRPRSLPPLTSSSTSSPVSDVRDSGGSGLCARELGLSDAPASGHPGHPGHPKETSRRPPPRRSLVQSQQVKTTA